MNSRWRDGIPALLAVALFALAEMLRLSKVLLQYWDNIEIISNALMLGIAIFFSAKVQFAEQEQSSSSRRVVWIILVSLIAFPMNVDVFGHAIRLERLLPDLWGWHSFWIICAVLQLLILTPLGKELLGQIKLMLAQLIGIMKWGKGITVTLGSILSVTVDYIFSFVKQSSKKMVFIITLGFFLWTSWLSTQVRGQDIRILLADISFIGKNLLVWIYYLFITFLVCLLPTVVRKTKEGLISLDRKHVMVVVAAATILVASVFLLPFMIGIVGALLVLISSLIAFVKWAVQKDKIKFDPKNNSPESPESGDSKSEGTLADFSPSSDSIRMEDLAILLVLFVAVPLFLVFILALPTTAGQELISNGPLDLTAWLDFGKSVLEITNALLQLFSIS